MGEIILYGLLACFVIGFIGEILKEILPPFMEGLCQIISACIGIYILFCLPEWILQLCGVQDSEAILNCCKFVFGIILLLIVYNQEDNHQKLVMLRWTIVGYLVGVWFGFGWITGLIGLIWGVCCYMDSKSKTKRRN